MGCEHDQTKPENHEDFEKSESFAFRQAFLQGYADGYRKQVMKRVINRLD